MLRMLLWHITHVDSSSLPPSLIKTTIVVPFYAMGRDTRYFRNPQQFNPDRWDRDHKEHHPFASLPFGFGPRACYGMCLHMPMLCCTTLGLVYSCVYVRVFCSASICVGRRLAELEMSLLLTQVICVCMCKQLLLCIIGFGQQLLLCTLQWGDIHGLVAPGNNIHEFFANAPLWATGFA